MKKFKYIFLVLFCLFFLSGCVKNNTTIGISKDKSMTYENVILFSNELGDDMTTLIKSSEYEEAGFKVTVVNEDGYKGIKISRKFDNIDDYSNNNGEEVNINDFLEKDFNKSTIFKRKTSFLKDTYTAKFNYYVDSSEYMPSESIDEDNLLLTEEDEENLEDYMVDSYENLIGEMKLSFNVKLPYKASSSNASEKSSNGKKLTWNFSIDTKNTIEFEFCIYNIKNIVIAGSGIVLFIIIVIILLVVLKKRKASKETLIHKDYDPSIENIINNQSVGNFPVNDINQNNQ